MLSAVKLKIGSFDLHDEEDKIQVEKTNQHIDNLIRRMREISYDLMPNTLRRKGLVYAIQEFIDYIGKGNSLAIRFSVSTDFIIDEQRSVHLYRVIQEIIHNTLKHAQATELIIDLRHDGQHILLSTRDNGVGFDQQVYLKEKGGLGLRNLFSRTEVMGGKMFLDSKKGKGTTYTFELPV